MLDQDMERVIDVFGLGRVQDFLTFSGYLKRQGISLNTLRHFVAECGPEYAQRRRRESMSSRREWAQKAPRCPECGAALLLREIALPTGRGNENGYRSEWFCAAGECLYEEFSPVTVQEQLKQYGLTGGRRLVRRCNKEK